MTRPWHTLSPDAVLDSIGTSHSGLSGVEARRRFDEYGPNALPDEKTEPWWMLFLGQFRSPLIYVLLAAAAAVFLIGEPMDAGIIFFVLLFNAVVGTVQEGRAQSTLRALKHFVATNATVVRDGRELIIPDSEVVPGDMLILQEGEKVAADCRIISSQNMKADEASFTGESVPVHKTTEALASEDIPNAERTNMVFKGTNIVAGHGRAVVVATGAATVIGGIAAEISAIDTDVPLKASIKHLSRAIIITVAAISAVFFTLGIAAGNSFVSMFTTVVSLAVSVIPEGLPIVMTLVLATGIWRMSKRHALVKKLQAVEALGQARVIAVDKTGTLTKNELIVRSVWAGGKTFDIGGEGYEPRGDILLEDAAIDAANHEELLRAARAAAFSANARLSFSEEEKHWRVSGDPTEAALLVFSEKCGFNKEELLAEMPLTAEIPFDYSLKYHAIVNASEHGDILTVVGAPEVVLSMCNEVHRGGHNLPLDKKERGELEAIFTAMSEKGLRVVAFASRRGVSAGITPESIGKLSFGGFFGMRDTLRAEAPAAVARAEAAGIRVVMITGDHMITARAIAAEAGIYHDGDTVLTGSEVDAMSDDDLAAKLHDTTVFARVTPEHKLRIINAYKKRGEIVAMTGDGVNDAPSLVAADLGVAMGGIGTEVAKEAADIVLLDDNFGSIVSAVEEGRSIYKTIKKVILYLFSTSAGEVLTIVGALVIGYPLPLLASQIIWLNFVTDGFLDVALAMEPKEKGLLSEEYAHPKRYIVDSLMARRMLTMAVPMMLGTLYMFHQYYQVDIEKAWTVSLTTLAVYQWFNAWNCRSEKESVFRMHPLSNKYLVGATAIVIVLQMLAVYSPLLQKILHTVPLGFADWLMIIPVAASIILVEEVRKFFHRLKSDADK